MATTSLLRSYRFNQVCLPVVIQSPCSINIVLGTTHLLIGSSGYPNAMPAFLTNNIPQIYKLPFGAGYLSQLPRCIASGTRAMCKSGRT